MEHDVTRWNSGGVVSTAQKKSTQEELRTAQSEPLKSVVSMQDTDLNLIPAVANLWRPYLTSLQPDPSSTHILIAHCIDPSTRHYTSEHALTTCLDPIFKYLALTAQKALPTIPIHVSPDHNVKIRAHMDKPYSHIKPHQVIHLPQHQVRRVRPDIVFLIPDLQLALPAIREGWEYSPSIEIDRLGRPFLPLPRMPLMVTEIKTDRAFYKILENGFTLATLPKAEDLESNNVGNAHARLAYQVCDH
ncbi:hypothetical protein PHLCEN_2v2526 [Hermanssonia centrifuga]|uniref:Uncharacterized protein n=1 Tax=Hermanssonia centrifuga TaxID=98765 RepID=A0A2R6RLN0_9APHY|nr:hypothetical protein PHLCEN_2v2526 [Hermanssonia centrifuga]